MVRNGSVHAELAEHDGTGSKDTPFPGIQGKQRAETCNSNKGDVLLE